MFLIFLFSFTFLYTISDKYHLRYEADWLSHVSSKLYYGHQLHDIVTADGFSFYVFTWYDAVRACTLRVAPNSTACFISSENSRFDIEL